MGSSEPAILTGATSTKLDIPITRPTLPDFDEVAEEFRAIFLSGQVTNALGVKHFEEKASDFLSVKHAVALNSCTSGLLLTWQALGIERGNEVILPSFTFAATGHSLLWNGLVPRFVDVDPDTFLLDPKATEQAINERTAAIFTVHTFGNPATPDAFEALANKYGLRLVTDSAHAIGADYMGRRVGGFGDAEVFSLSPTKLVVASEGGLATTNDDAIARHLRLGKDYGNPGDYDCEFAGISARMSEFHAVIAADSLSRLDDNIAARSTLAEIYRDRLGALPGIRFQTIVKGASSTYKDMAIVVDSGEFGLDRNQLGAALEAEGVTTRKYFFPPLHEQKAYAQFASQYEGALPVTEHVSRNVLCLPLYSHMERGAVEEICSRVAAIFEHRDAVSRALKAV